MAAKKTAPTKKVAPSKAKPAATPDHQPPPNPPRVIERDYRAELQAAHQRLADAAG